MDDPNITMEEYISLEKEKSRRHGKLYNWETATYGRIWYDDDVHDLGSVETKFPAIVRMDDPNITMEEYISLEKEKSRRHDSEVHNNKSCIKTCLKNYETLKKQCDDLIVKLNQTEFIAATYKRGIATIEEQLVTYKKNEVLFSKEVVVLKREVACKDYKINVLKSEYEKVKQEKEGIEFKIEKFDNASKSLDKLIGSQITNYSKKGLGYHAVPTPHPLIYNGPTKLDLSYSSLDEFKEPEFKGYGPRDSKLESNINHDKKSDDSKENSDDSFVKQKVSEDTSSFVESPLNVDKETAFSIDKKIEFVKPVRKLVRGIATIEEQLVTNKKNEVLFSKEVVVLKREVACKDYEINVLKSEYEKVKQEKEGIEFKIEKFDNASKSLDKLIGSQITNYSKKGLGYHAVPTPHHLIYNRPTKLDLSYSSLDEFKEPEFKGYGPRDSKLESNINHDKKSDDSKENSDDSFVKQQVSEDTSSFVESPLNVDTETAFSIDKKIEFVKPVRKLVRYAEMYRSQYPRGN
nr:hypothetical protein [Tanacetum cinerariifolium]